MKVVFFVRRIGPYHHARFSAAAKVVDLVVVQTRPASQEYPWDFTAGSNYPVESFPVNDAELGIKGSLLHETVANVLDKHQPNIVITTGWADQEYHAVILAAVRRKINRVVISDSRYEDVPRRWITEKLKELILHSYSAAIVAGTRSKAYLQKLGFDTTNIFQPWDVVDNSYFASKAVSTISFNERSFLCVSRFIEKKNIIRLIEAFSSYRKSGGHRKLVLAGDGELKDEIVKKISSEGLNSFIEFPGFVQYPDLPRYLGQCLCLILPSVSDQWGLVVNEAMASARPVLVSDQCGCAPDLVEDGKNGYTFDPLNVQQLADRLMAIDRMSEKEWLAMGDASKRKIATKSTEAFAKALSDSCSMAMNQKTERRLHTDSQDV
ncbi:MAG: glycosyltransferase family 4 protein [Bacteroidota bacterium]